MPTDIHALSDTLLLHVLSFLDPSTLRFASCTSRRLRYLAESDRLWKPLCLRRFPDRHIPTDIRADEVERRVRNMQKKGENDVCKDPEWVKRIRFQRRPFDPETTPLGFTSTYWSWKRTYLGDLRLEDMQKRGTGKGNRIGKGI